MLGLRSALRDATGVSCAKLTIGTTLRLPGEFYENTEEEDIQDTFDYIKKLHKTFCQLRPTPASIKRKESVFIHPDLYTSKAVYLRIGRVKKSLVPPYEGPYQVVKRTKKWFRIVINGKEEDVTIDRLKPAYSLNDTDDNTHNTHVPLEKRKSCLKPSSVT